MTDLRSFLVLDSLQPQCASFLASTAQGYLPEEGQAALLVEVSPGIEINRLTDVALKATAVMPGLQVVERLYGLLEVHSHSQADVRQAGDAILDAIGADVSARIKPRVFASQVIRNVDDRQAMLVNRMRRGNMLLKGQTLYILELAPAAYAAIAANEAEKAANINILEVVCTGSYGRLYIGGEERDVDVAWRAAEQALEALDGRPCPFAATE